MCCCLFFLKVGALFGDWPVEPERRVCGDDGQAVLAMVGDQVAHGVERAVLCPNLEEQKHGVSLMPDDSILGIKGKA